MKWLWNNLIRPAAFAMDAEHAHELGLKMLRAVPLKMDADFGEFGPVSRMGLEFRNPLGLAAGFDKNGVAVDQIADLGFGFVEVGTVTLQPQSGNAKPRLFRLPSDRALINRLGFNNDGADVVADRLSGRDRHSVAGINIGRNKDTPNENAIENYLEAFERVHAAADYIAVNISSPNTPGLRELQGSGFFAELFSALIEKNRAMGARPLLAKIAPDLSDPELETLVKTSLDLRLDGIIATNTTISRDGLTADHEKFGAGGLSGRPLRERSTEMISRIYSLTAGRQTIIGVGGIFNAEDAFDKIGAGASLVQAYTGFVYGGPTFAADLITRLARILRQRGFESYDEAVGSAKRRREV